jgi:hypothetical protein
MAIPPRGALLSTGTIQYFIFTFAKHTWNKVHTGPEEGSYSKLEKIT